VFNNDDISELSANANIDSKRINESDLLWIVSAISAFIYNNKGHFPSIIKIVMIIIMIKSDDNNHDDDDDDDDDDDGNNNEDSSISHSPPPSCPLPYSRGPVGRVGGPAYQGPVLRQWPWP